MRIFIIGNTPIGISWVGRILEDIAELPLRECSEIEQFENRSELSVGRFKDYEDGIWELHGASVWNVKCLVGEIDSKDRLIVVDRCVEDCVCEVAEGDGLEGMDDCERKNFELEKNPHMLVDLVTDRMELGIKMYGENTFNVGYDDLCDGLHEVIRGLIGFLGLAVKKSDFDRVKSFSNVGRFKCEDASKGYGKSNLDKKFLTRIGNIKRKLRGK